MKSDYLIFSKQKTQDIAVWWRPYSAGYTTDINTAGRYTYDEATRIVADSRGEELMIHYSDLISKLVTRTIVDLGDFNNHMELRRMDPEYVEPTA